MCGAFGRKPYFVVHRRIDTSGLMMFAKDIEKDATYTAWPLAWLVGWRTSLCSSSYRRDGKDMTPSLSLVNQTGCLCQFNSYDDEWFQINHPYRTIKKNAKMRYSLVELRLKPDVKIRIRVFLLFFWVRASSDRDRRYGIDGSPNPLGRLALHAFGNFVSIIR